MAKQSQFELYRDGGGEWRWLLVVQNGNIIAASGEGYNSKQGVKRGIESVRPNVSTAEITVADDQ